MQLTIKQLSDIQIEELRHELALEADRRLDYMRKLMTPLSVPAAVVNAPCESGVARLAREVAERPEFRHLRPISADHVLIEDWCLRFYTRVVKNGTLVTSGMPHLYDRRASQLPFRGGLLKDFAAEYFGEIPEEFADRRFPPVRPPLLDPAGARDAALIAECDKIMADPYLGPAAVVPGPAPGPVLVPDEKAELTPAEYDAWRKRYF